MQQNYIPASDFADYFPHDVFCRCCVPVVASDVPHDRFEAHAAREAQDGRAAASKWRPEQIRMLAYRVGQGLLAFRKLRGQFVSALEGEERMSERVVANDVPRLREVADN